MSKFVGLGKGVKFVVQKFVGKKSPTITSVKPKVGSLTRRRKDQDSVIKSADKAIQKNKLTKEQGVAVKKTIAPGLKKISKTQDDIDRLKKRLSAKGKEKLREKKMGGGMMGRRMGYSQGSNGKIKFDAKKSDLDKSGSLSPYEKRRGMAIAKAMAKRKKKV